MAGLCGEAPGHNAQMPTIVAERTGCAAGAFWESQGPCVVEGACVTIPYERPHEFCELTVAAEGTLRTGSFATEECCDLLSVDGAVYSGLAAPWGNELSPGSNLLWQSDGTVASWGWTVCLDTQPSIAYHGGSGTGSGAGSGFAVALAPPTVAPTAPMQASGELMCGNISSQWCAEREYNISADFNHTHIVSTFSQLQAALSDSTLSPVIDIQADITVPEQLHITQHITLLSSTGSQLSGNHTKRILHIEGYVQVAAYGIVFRDGKPRATGNSRRRNAAGSRHGGAVFVEGHANFSAYNCLFVNNHADRGGAVHVSYSSTFNAEQCVFSANSAYSYGGAVDAVYSTFVCIGCLLVDNKADNNYAAIYSNIRLKLRDTHLSNNSVTLNPDSSVSVFAPRTTNRWTSELSITCSSAAASTMTDDDCNNCANQPNCEVNRRSRVRHV